MTITVTRYFQSVPFIPATIWTFVIRWSIYVNFISYLISFTISGFVLYTIKNHASGVWMSECFPATALWDLTPLFQLYGGQKTNFLIWTVLGEIITVLTCIWLVRTASSLRLAETNSEDPFFFSEVLAQIWWQEWISGWLNYQFEYHCISVW